jgi:hypothetical protein
MITPYETYNNKVGVKLSFLVKHEPDPQKRVYEPHEDSLQLISYKAYNQRALRSSDLRLRAGLGKGNEVLISWSYIEKREQSWKDILCSTFGNPKVEHNPMEEHFGIDGRATAFYMDYPLKDGSKLTDAEQFQAVINASAIQAFARLKAARESMHKRMGNSSRGLWPGLMNDLNGFREVLKTKFSGITHTLPTSERRLREDLKGFSQMSYEYYIDGRKRNNSAAKVATTKQAAMLEALLRKNNNYNNEQVAEFYNMAAETLGWKQIDAGTVANKRKELGLWITSGNRGVSEFTHNIAMQNKRSAPSVSMVYWTVDGWDAELLFQTKEENEKGHSVTTYHNRLTVVVVLDPVAGVKYPIGYAIGTHETPALITEALRNAANHTAELFGERYKVLQLQSDRYAISKLGSIYEGVSQHYTPAAAHNAKAKVIEPYFSYLNKQCQKYFPNNWSGFGVTSRKENQPNADFTNQIRHTLPDEQGCREQIHRLIAMEREAKIEEYMMRWEMLPEADKLSMSDMEYLMLFGQTHTHTNRLQGEGLTPTLGGDTLVFDTFDARFRELRYMDWAIKYDPADLSKVLVLNAKCDGNRRVTEVLGTHRFMLDQKYVQPMAIYDQSPEDASKRKEVKDFNKQLMAAVVERAEANQQLLDATFAENPRLNDTLTKMVLTDSTGNHKDQRNKARAVKANKQTIKLPPAAPVNYEVIDEDIRSNY